MGEGLGDKYRGRVCLSSRLGSGTQTLRVVVDLQTSCDGQPYVSSVTRIVKPQ